jgi:hypothetical protein
LNAAAKVFMDAKDIAAGTNAKRLKIVIAVALLLLVYVPSRFCVLKYSKPSDGDTELYARYAYIHRLASERQLSFHGLYRAMGIDYFNQGGGPRKFDSLTLTVVAYPPFAVAVMALPALLVRGARTDLPAFTSRYMVYKGLPLVLRRGRNGCRSGGRSAAAGNVQKRNSGGVGFPDVFPVPGGPVHAADPV